ncbi:uncharacterized protein N7511_009386 [Penicillium nucicola]|uniref:uncharacterized protein n=1 Tax=Penicillium nucicola TaxID=1850975 RepID=UPI0025459000|nr:uncharacterized protein N7511_009386 [Penicillium nucicola]KAJ5747690.1 hypothetical protein N7511_009386 [Penicillium nucicola]
MRLAFALAVLSAICSPLASAITEAPEGYGIDIPEWEIEITPGGNRVILNGTIEEAHDEILKLNPKWDEEFLADLPVEDQPATLVKRTDFYGAKYVCGKWTSARYKPISNGIKYLRGIKGNPRAGPGPSNCARVSCSYKSAIWWCNDSKSSKTLNSFGSIADGALYVLGHCTNSGAGISNPTVDGQAFHKTDWNVIVKGASC